MNHLRELTLMRTPTPQELRDYHGLVIPDFMLRRFNAHIEAEVHETYNYLDAYERCTVPDQTSFQDFAELDDEIIRQLTAANFQLPVGPNMQAKLYKLVWRIREKWTVQYGLTFRGQVRIEGMTAPPGVLQVFDPTTLPCFDPTILPWTANGHSAPAAITRGTGGEVVHAFVANTQHPNVVPGTLTPYVSPTLPPRSDFTFRAPPPRPTQPGNSGRPTTFAGRSIAPKPLFAEGQEIKLTWFERYTSLDKIYTKPKRKMTERILKDLPHESVARCMEALFRCENDVDEAQAWLRQTASNAQGKHAVELFDSDDEGQKQYEEPGHGRAKKKQRLENDPLAGVSKKAKGEHNRKSRDVGTVQKLSDKTMSYLLTNPWQNSSTQHGTHTQRLLGPGISHQSSQREVIDLTGDGGDLMNLDESHRLPTSATIEDSTMSDPPKSRQVLFGSARTVTPGPSTAAVSVSKQNKDGEHSSMAAWNGALPESASRRDSAFGTLSKPVFGSAWQPTPKGNA